MFPPGGRSDAGTFPQHCRGALEQGAYPSQMARAPPCDASTIASVVSLMSDDWLVFDDVTVPPSPCLFARWRETSSATLFALSNIACPNGLFHRLHVESRRRSSAIQSQTGDTLDQTPARQSLGM